MQIHPAIGIARVGDSPDSFYLGPEAAQALPTEVDGTPVQTFKDRSGAVRRQAARFRVFDGDTEVVIGSVVGGRTVTDIAWTAHIANKKAIMYEFLQLQGEHGYTTAVVNGETVPFPLRNASVTDPATRLKTLIIDPGPRTVSQGAPNASFDDDTRYPATFPPSLDPVSIGTLGDLELDDQGRLLLLGGHGHSGTTDGPPELEHYANNPGWFDDVSDGPVSATIHFHDGSSEEAEGAWVLVAPPAYAPQILNQVTLYDVLFDLFVRTVPGFRDDICANGVFDEDYAPSMPSDILPFLQRTNGYPWVATRQQGSDEGEQINAYTSKVLAAPHEFGALTATSTLNARFLQRVLRTDPNDPFLRLSSTPAMPFLAGDNPIDDTLVSKYLTVTPTQRFFIDQWANGRATDEAAPSLGPAMALTAGVLGNCVGGPFCPGIEAGWIFRDPALYSAPFRIKRKPVGEGLSFDPTVGPSEPGDLTQRMAQPWQSDFNQCSFQKIRVSDREKNTGDGPQFYTLWWPAQRPMAVYTRPGQQSAENWARDSAGNELTNVDMAEHWSKLGFVVARGDDFVEVERSPTPFGRPAEAPVTAPSPVASAALRGVLDRLLDPSEAGSHPDLASKLAQTHPEQLSAVAASMFSEGALPTREEKKQCQLVDDELTSRYGTDLDDIERPSTVPELVALVRKALDNGMSLRAVGSARSLSDAPEPADNSIMVSTCRFCTPMALDPETLKDPSQAEWLYRCGSGRTLKEVLQELDPNPDQPVPGMARTLENMGSGQFQSVAGLLSTASHGSGITKPSVPDLIAGLELVTVDADGEVVARRIEPTDGPTDPSRWAAHAVERDVPIQLVQDDVQFQAAVVSIGCMGVIYSLTLKLVKGFYLREQREVTWWSAVKPNLEQLLHDNDYFELVLAPIQSDNNGTPDNACLTSKRNVVDTYTDCGRRPVLMEVATTEIGRIVAAVTLEWALKNPPARVPWVLHTGVHSSAVACYTDKNYHVLQLDMDINASSTEQNVPVHRAPDAIQAVLDHAQRQYDAFSDRFGPGKSNDLEAATPWSEDPKALMAAWKELAFPTSPLGIRFVPAGEAFMGPFYQRATCTIEMPMTGSDYLDQRAAEDERNQSQLVRLYESYLAGRRKLFQDVEALLNEQFDARPHWGQANYLDNETARAVSPGFDKWLVPYQAYNTRGTFNGAFTHRLRISVYPEHEPVDLPDGPVSGEAIFRHQRAKDRGILKLKGHVGWAIYQGLTQPLGTRCEWLFPNKCKRMGVSVIASTQNWIDPVVCELRFSPEGELLSRTEDYELYHSLSQNRQHGQATFDGERLTITGDAALGLQEFVNAGRRVSAESVLPQGPVVLELLDMATGHWSIESL